MKTTAYKFNFTWLLIFAFLMMAGYSQSQNNCVPDSLTATNVTAHSANLAWEGIQGPTHVRYYPTGTTTYEVRDAHMNHICLHNLTPNTPYSWDLSNFCNGVWTEYAGNGSFTTLTDSIPPPPPPTCVPDSLTAANVTDHSANLSWEGLQGPTWVRFAPAGDTAYRYVFAHRNHAELRMLAPETNYSWALNNFCNGQWTGYLGNGSFTTLTDTIPPPPPPTCVPDSLTATNVTDHSANLSWEGLRGPTWVRFAPAGDTAYRYVFAHRNHAELRMLAPETTYSWALNNFCNGQWTGYLGNGSFTTLTDSIPPPPPPTCVPDSLTATNVTDHSANLSWEGIQGPTWVRFAPAGDTAYHYVFAHNNHAELRMLAPETTYSWALNNFCNGQWTGYLGDGSFTTLTDTIPPPPPPTCVPDSLTATNVTSHSADLEWQGIEGPTWVRFAPAGDTAYRYVFAHRNHAELHMLAPGTVYSWALNNFCNGQWTGYLGNGSFTTLTDSIPPPPSCIPTNLADSNVTAFTVDLRWGGIHGATHVRYYPTGTTNYMIRNAHMNHITLDSLTPNTPYSWDLSNYCNGAWTEYTGDGSFTTLTEMYITGIGNINGVSFSNLSVYPNPMKEKVTVTFTASDNGSYIYKIIDITGRELSTATDQATAGKNSFELNLTGTPKGIYFLQLQKGSELQHVKLVKQ